MWLMLIALLLQQAQAPMQAQQEGPQPEPPRYDQGDLRVTLSIMYEQRFKFLEEFPGRLPESTMMMRMRLAGEGITNLVRVGNVVPETAVDEAGKDLASEDMQSEEYRNYTRTINARPQQLAEGGWPLQLQLAPTARGAEKLKEMSGYVLALFADETEDIVILDPLSFSGKKIEHPRLAELGIDLAVLPPGNPPAVRDNEQVVALQPGAGAEKIAEIKFLDAWLRPIHTRPPREMPTNEGDMAMVYQTVNTPLQAEMQMVVTVHPNIRTEKVEFSFTDVELP